MEERSDVHCCSYWSELFRCFVNFKDMVMMFCCMQLQVEIIIDAFLINITTLQSCQRKGNGMITMFILVSLASEKLRICKSLSACSVELFSPMQI